MDRKVAVLAAVFALAVGSGEAIKCYMCNTLTNSSCGSDIANSAIKPVECTAANINSFQSEMKNNQILSTLAEVFEVHLPGPENSLPSNSACAKTDLLVGIKKVTIRNCQIAKTESMDPCATMKLKLRDLNGKKNESMMSTLEFCDVCGTESCNGAMAMVPKTFYMTFPVITALALANGNYMA